MDSEKWVYVIDDEADICDLVVRELNRYGISANGFLSAKEGLEAIKKKKPLLCIVDLGLPDMDGLLLVRQIRNISGVGVLILSGRDSLPDKVLGLEVGADDYMIKPFEPRELVARVNSLLRRLSEQSTHEVVVQQRVATFAGWQFDPSTLTLTSELGESSVLSAAESEMLMALLRSPRKILSREQLLADRSAPYDRSIDVRMSRLRKKIEVDPKNPVIIKTVYGVGYLLASEVQWFG